jgi:predicted Fe-Mo cluster-binding NifX family protein
MKICKKGHQFDHKNCPVCPVCLREELAGKFDGEFPNIGAPALRALNNEGITKLSDLAKYTEKELLALHGFGPKALEILREALKIKGLSYANLSKK